MHFDARPLLAHVVDHAPHKGIGVIDVRLGRLSIFALIVKVIRPLIAVPELHGGHAIGAVLGLGFGTHAQPFGAFGDYFM